MAGTSSVNVGMVLYISKVTMYKVSIDFGIVLLWNAVHTPAKPGVSEAGQASPLKSHTSMHLLSRK